MALASTENQNDEKMIWTLIDCGEIRHSHADEHGKKKHGEGVKSFAVFVLIKD